MFEVMVGRGGVVGNANIVPLHVVQTNKLMHELVTNAAPNQNGGRGKRLVVCLNECMCLLATFSGLGHAGLLFLLV